MLLFVTGERLSSGAAGATTTFAKNFIFQLYNNLQKQRRPRLSPAAPCYVLYLHEIFKPVIVVLTNSKINNNSKNDKNIDTARFERLFFMKLSLKSRL